MSEITKTIVGSEADPAELNSAIEFITRVQYLGSEPVDMAEFKINDQVVQAGVFEDGGNRWLAGRFSGQAFVASIKGENIGAFFFLD